MVTVNEERSPAKGTNKAVSNVIWGPSQQRKQGGGELSRSKSKFRPSRKHWTNKLNKKKSTMMNLAQTASTMLRSPSHSSSISDYDDGQPVYKFSTKLTIGFKKEILMRFYAKAKKDH